MPQLTNARWKALGWFLAAAVLVWRVWLACGMPIATADLLRHFLYGGLAIRDGFWTAGHSLIELNPRYEVITWAGVPYSYPCLTLFFFTGAAAVWPTMAAARLALTAIEAINAALVWRLTGRAGWGLLYWAAPTAVFWASREGQFEPLQNLFVLLSLVRLRRSPWQGAALLALAVQVKVTAILLAPWMAWKLVEKGKRTAGVSAAAFALGFLPSALAQFAYPAFAQPFLFSRPLTYNPYWWNFLDEKMFAWNPGWLIAWNQAVTWAAVLFVVRCIIQRKGDRLAYLAPLVYLIFIKLNSNVNYWYFLIWPTLVLPVADRRDRAVLLALWLLLDMAGLVYLLDPSWGNLMPAWIYAGHGPLDPIIPLPLKN